MNKKYCNQMLKYNGNESKSHTFTTPTQDTSKRNSHFAKSHERPFTAGVDLFESSYKNPTYELNGASPQVLRKTNTKLEYPKNLLPAKGVVSKLDEVYIEDRFSKTYSQPLMCYGDNRAIGSPYKNGAKNLRYASPNYVSNAVFYDQTSNLSIDKNEMYKTTTQRYFTPQKNRLQNNIDSNQKCEYYSPLRHMMNDRGCVNQPKKSKLASKYDCFTSDNQKLVGENYNNPNNWTLIQKLHSRKNNMNLK